MSHANSLHILFVEDVPSDFELAEREIRKGGLKFTSLRVDTRDTFLRALEEFQPDVIVSDYSMPEFDGMQALKLSLERDADIPFIMLTGSTNEEIAVECMKAGATDYVIKRRMTRLPFAVKEALAQKKMSSEKREAERALRESEERYRRLFESASLGIFQSTPEGKAISVNPAFARMFGYDSPKDAVQSIKDVAIDLFVDPNRRTEIIRLMAEQPDLRSFENLYRRKDGSSFVGSLNTMPITDSDGRLVRVEGIIEDITERARAAAEQLESETRYRQLFDASPDGLVVIGPDGCITRANIAQARMYRYDSPNDLIGVHATQLVAMSSRDYSAQILQRRLNGEQIPAVEYELVRKDGTTFYGETSATSLRNADGSVSGYICVTHDTTERKRTQEAIEENERKYRELFDLAPIGYHELDIQGRIIRINSTELDMLGYTREEMIGQFAWRFVGDHDGSQQRILDKMKGIILPSRSEERDYRRKDGTTMSVLVEDRILRDSANYIVGIRTTLQDVTARKETEESLKNSEARFRSVWEGSADGMRITDKEGTIVEVNDAYCQLVGAIKEELEGRSFNEVYRSFEEENQLATQRYKERFLERGILPKIETTLQLKAGKTVAVEMSNAFLDSADGQPLLLSIFRDVTERKLADEALRESLERFQLANRATFNTIWDWNLQTNALWWNENLELTFGHKPEEIEPGIESWANRIHPEDLELVKTGIYTAIDSGKQSWSDEYRFRRKDGRYAVVADRGFVHRDTSGKPMRMIGAMEDITERKEMEGKLRESEAYYRTLIETTPDAIVLVDINGMITFASPRSYMVFDIPAGQNICGMSLMTWVHPDEHEKIADRLHEIFTLGVEPSVHEYHLLKSDGTPFWGEINASRLPGSGGNGAGLLMMCRDVTENRKLHSELIQSQKMQSIGTLAGGIAHDFNNILAIILGYTSFLENTKVPPERKAEGIVAIKSAVQRGAALVRQILTFARKSEVLFEPMNLADLLHEIVSMLQQTFPRTITFDEKGEKEIPLISADHTQMHQALLNLCVNARDAMPQGGTITFTIAKKTGVELRERYPAAEMESYLCLGVADTGEGMTESIRSKIFDPFFTTKEKGRGTGLGLSVVFGVMEAHHGFIDVESVLGQGTAFHLYFPALPPGKIAPTSKKEEDLIGLGGTETVLLVEDEEYLLNLARLTLESQGYHVYDADDGPKAVEIYRVHHEEIALVLSDIGLPGMSGVEVFRILKGINPVVKLLFMSGFIEPDVRSQVLQLGPKGIIEKPYTPRELLVRLRAALDEKKL